VTTMGNSKLQNPREKGRSCHFCGGTNFRLLHEWEPEHPRNSASITVGYWECDCKLAFLDPIPTPAQLPSNGDWWSPERKEVRRNPTFKEMRVRLQYYLFGTGQSRLIQQTRKLVPSGRLLDIGCGTGQLLETARPYFQCHGLEPSEVAAKQARAKGFRVVEATLESASLAPDDKFAVVTLDAVLEHLVDPVETLVRINRLMPIGGVVVIKVPKMWGPTHHSFGREWNGFRVGYHTVMFSGQTLGNVLKATGFEPTSYPRRDRPLDDILILWGRKVAEMPIDPEALVKAIARRRAA
jgi:SAM-dependent methyltransferase